VSASAQTTIRHTHRATRNRYIDNKKCKLLTLPFRILITRSSRRTNMKQIGLQAKCRKFLSNFFGISIFTFTFTRVTMSESTFYFT